MDKLKIDRSEIKYLGSLLLRAVIVFAVFFGGMMWAFSPNNEVEVIRDKSEYLKIVNEVILECDFNEDCIKDKLKDRIPYEYQVKLKKIKGGYKAKITTRKPNDKELVNYTK
jgi:hypothetical protein